MEQHDEDIRELANGNGGALELLMGRRGDPRVAADMGRIPTDASVRMKLTLIVAP